MSEKALKDLARGKAIEAHRISYTQLDDWHIIEAYGVACMKAALEKLRRPCDFAFIRCDPAKCEGCRANERIDKEIASLGDADGGKAAIEALK